MKELQEMAVDHEIVANTMKQAVRRIRKGGMALGDVSGVAENVLVKAFGKERGESMTSKASQDIMTRRPFAMFEGLSDQDLANLLVEEHPQIAAVFLGHLDQGLPVLVPQIHNFRPRCENPDQQATV